jgi:hypothetical protein
MQWTSHFFEVVIVASCNESVSLPEKKSQTGLYVSITPSASQHSDAIFSPFFGWVTGILHPPSGDEGTERTWFEPEQRPKKCGPKQSVNGKEQAKRLGEPP